MLSPLWAIAADLTRRFPAGDDPFQMMTRLLEECGELAEQVNHAERSGVKWEKHGDPEPQKMAKEVMDVVRCALTVAQYYGIEREVEGFFEERLAACKQSPPSLADADSPATRPRVSAAVLRADDTEVLMVQHLRRDGTRYWQLPGGGVLPHERPEAAALRELWEETGLRGEVRRRLFTIPYRLGMSTTYLVEVVPDAEAMLGQDPEEDGADHQKLVDVDWWRLQDVEDSPEVEILQVILPYVSKPG